MNGDDRRVGEVRVGGVRERGLGLVMDGFLPDGARTDRTNRGGLILDGAEPPQQAAPRTPSAASGALTIIATAVTIAAPARMIDG